MKTSRFSKSITAALLAGSLATWTACTDSWNEHYDVSQGGMSDQPTIYENIKSDTRLNEFCRVVESIDATNLLNSSQQLTVWAPRNLTKEQADSIIAVYQADNAQGLKWTDNRAVTQFLQNHIAQFARNVSSLTNDTIKMMSKKYMQLVGKSATEGTIDGNAFNDATISSNGILYKADDVLRFFPNVREYLEQTEGLDSIVKFIASFDEYELDEQASVAGGIVDGKTVYLDSVTNLTNNFLSSYGYIQREDSTYTFLAPTNEVWNTEYEKYHKYYNYNPKTVVNSDSLADANTKSSIVRGRFFNTSGGNRYNRHAQDSLVNTAYSERQQHNPRTNVYYKPEENLLNGLEKVECSNGYVYVDNKGVIDSRTTFFTRNDYPANYGRYYQDGIPKDDKDKAEVNVSPMRYNITDVEGTILKSYDYVEVSSVSESGHATLTYQLPSTMSGAYYNIYIVTVPNRLKYLPTWFGVQYQQLRSDGSFTNPASFENPHPVSEATDIDNLDIILNNAESKFSATDLKNLFVSNATKLDTILVKTAANFTYSSLGAGDGVVKLTFKSMGPAAGTYREKIYTRTIRLNEIIFVPFETEEDAKANAERIIGADGLPHYRFDDEYLEEFEKNKNVE